MSSLKESFPDALIQFEDFATPNAYELLSRYRQSSTCFNDDIQAVHSGRVKAITPIFFPELDSVRRLPER